MTESLIESARLVRNYLEWQQAIHGGGATLEAHRQLVAEDRPFPTQDDALAAISRIERALEWE